MGSSAENGGACPARPTLADARHGGQPHRSHKRWRSSSVGFCRGLRAPVHAPAYVQIPKPFWARERRWWPASSASCCWRWLLIGAYPHHARCAPLWRCGAAARPVPGQHYGTLAPPRCCPWRIGRDCCRLPRWSVCTITAPAAPPTLTTTTTPRSARTCCGEGRCGAGRWHCAELAGCAPGLPHRSPPIGDHHACLTPTAATHHWHLSPLDVPVYATGEASQRLVADVVQHPAAVQSRKSQLDEVVYLQPTGG